MKYTKKRIYDLLPAIYRQRDIENGSPLKALVNIIAEQIKIVEGDIEGLHDNWFIETCDEWAVAYKADLIRARMLYPVSDATYSMRTWVANTIGYRRRKGTLAVLEQLARDVTGWDAKAIEFFELLITTQYLNHLRPSNLSSPNLRDSERLDKLSTPFNSISHTLDVRRISRQRGYYNIPNIGIFFWRLQSLPRNCPAFDHGEGRFSFNQLGYDEPIFNHRKLETGSAGVAEEINVSAPIRMRAMDQSLSSYYYDNSIGEKEGTSQTSIQITVDGSIKSQRSITVCNLTNWVHRPPLGQIAVDPILGRILFPNGEIPRSVHTRHYYGFSSKIGGGFYERPITSSDFVDAEKPPLVYRISKDAAADPGKIYTTLLEATSKWASEGRKNAIFEILDSESYYEDALELDIPSQIKIVVRSKQLQQAVLRMRRPIKIKGNAGSSSIIFDGLIFDTLSQEEGEEEDNTNNNILNILQGDLGSLSFRHCTLVPGRNKDTDYESKFLFSWKDIPGSPSNTDRLRDFLFENFENLKWINDPEVKFEFISEKILKISTPSVSDYFLTISLDGTEARLEINYTGGPGGEPPPPASPKPAPEKIHHFFVGETAEGEIKIYNPKSSVIMIGGGSNENLIVSLDNTICGRIFMTQSEAKMKLNDSIVDGKGSIDALTCYKCTAMENSTIFGRSNFSILEFASNNIFTDIVFVKRIQIGCVRFCYVPDSSRTPRRYHCQPEYFNATKAPLKNGDDDNHEDGDISLNLIPKFTSVKYGDPGYAQLHKNNILGPIFDGGDNGSEIGVFNHLHQAQRIKNIKSSLDEYLRFGLEAGIFLVT